jgi:hypothetical protein
MSEEKYFLGDFCHIAALKKFVFWAETEAQTKRQATQHGCLPTVPSWLQDGDKKLK